LRFAKPRPLQSLLVKLHPLAVEAFLGALQIAQVGIASLAQLIDLRLELGRARAQRARLGLQPRNLLLEVAT